MRFALFTMHCFYPERVEFANGANLDLCKLSNLTFETPDYKRFSLFEKLRQDIAQENSDNGFVC